MSYILEALRKSEQQRSRMAAPTRPPELAFAPEPPAPRSRYLWLLPVGAAIIAVAGGKAG